MPNELSFGKRQLTIQVHKVTFLVSDCLTYILFHLLNNSDIKSSNCGFLATGKLQLFDFGFCRSLPTNATTTTALADDTTSSQSFQDPPAADINFHMSMAGTIRYMSP
jgi:serine/threonine protein kinase